MPGRVGSAVPPMESAALRDMMTVMFHGPAGPPAPRTLRMTGHPRTSAAIVAALLGVAICSATSGAEVPPAAARRVEFERDVRPLLTATCVSCHGPAKQKGGLRLDRKGDALRGGDSGPVIVPGKGAESSMVLLASGADANQVMPPKGTHLTAEQVGVLRAWIDQGADWPGAAEAADPRDWWSLRPLSLPAVPALASGDAARARNPVDAFVLAKLREQGLSPSPEADRRTLIRRLSFDLTGLPPTPEEVDAFTDDPAPDAYESLVDRLLASPHYGERWARHWLDVAHYGDTHGYDKDQPRPFAWPYRDYVIRALNDDKPYARFVREQVAGDVLFPGTPDGVIALGFLAAGPWDLIGHAEVPETKIDGKIARHLDRDDMVANTINTFLSMTVQCAQCHNHKFDPIRQEDYYRLQAVFAALDRADRPYYPDPTAAAKARELAAARAKWKTRREELDAEVQRGGGAALVELDRKLAAASGEAAPRAEFGYHSGIEAGADRVKWVQVDLGRPGPVERVVLWGAHDSFNNIGAGFGFPPRFKVELADDPEFRADVSVIADQTGADVPNPGIAPQVFPTGGKSGRYLRVTATKLAPRQGDFLFALAELEAFDAAGKNRAAGLPALAFDSIEAPARWSKANLTDGHAPGRAQTADLEPLREERRALLANVTDPATARALAEVVAGLAKVDAEIAKVPPTGLVYAATIHDGGASAFRGTGPDGGKPRTIRILRRGDVRDPGAEVGPGALAVSAELSGDFDLPPDHSEGDRRAALARWLTDPRNPLTWRSIVNRAWQGHFGRGIAATPSDFGRMGQPPSHPELLDWLAAGFRDGGQSLKGLHRLLVRSATYRQSSAVDSGSEGRDAGNVDLWRMPRRKLEAEEIRDSALAVAGTLDRTRYGPAFQDFVVEHPEHSPHYEYQRHDPEDPKARRRSIYRFLVRSKPQPFMTALDCADPSAQVDRRTETLSPLQALALYNNGFMLSAAKHLAAAVEPAGGPEEQVAAALRRAVGRSPSAAERDDLAVFAKEHGLANACRVILNLNEFVFVD